MAAQGKVSEPEKPLHVRVAEALGCKPKLVNATYGEWRCTCRNRAHAHHGIHRDCCHDREGLGCDEDTLADYSTDWSATGPLIEKYEICLNRDEPQKINDAEWVAAVDYYGPLVDSSDAPYGGRWTSAQGTGNTALVAVCHVILALAAAGKL